MLILMETNHMCLRKKTKLKKKQSELELLIKQINSEIKILGDCSSKMFNSIENLQDIFDSIKNIPNNELAKFKKLKNVRLNWKEHAEKIEQDYQNAYKKELGFGAIGAVAGASLASFGPSIAMGVATTYGVASTGTAISSLSGVAASNAALSWLGGGTLAAGGGGIAAGKVLLKFLGKIGWGIGGATLIISGIFSIRTDVNKKRLDSIFISIINRDIVNYKLAIVELNERIKRINEGVKCLNDAICELHSFGTNYDEMTEKQQYALGSYVNYMNSSTQLLVNPIMGILPKYSKEDLHEYISWEHKKSDDIICVLYEDFVCFMTNFLYKVKLNKMDKKVLLKSIKKNKELLETFNMTKEDLNNDIFNVIQEALLFKYPDYKEIYY